LNVGSVEQTFSLQVPSSTGNLALIRDFVTRVGGQAGLDEVEIGNLELAVDEACANVIEHAYEHDYTKQVVIRAIYDEDTLRIEVVDTGKGFDPQSVQSADIQRLAAERKTGGLGLRLIKTLMDEVHYEVVPGTKNELVMVKRLRK
jgi:serine/threonine-protein kinase RsbW